MLSQMHARRIDHILVDEIVDAPGERWNCQAGVPGKRSQGRLRGCEVDAHAAADKIAGIEVAEHQVSIGHRWARTTPAIASRTRFGAGALRTDLHKPDVVEVCN